MNIRDHDKYKFYRNFGDLSNDSVVWDIEKEEHEAVIEELKNRGWRQVNDRKV